MKYLNFTRGLTLMSATLSHSMSYTASYFLIFAGVYTAHSELLRRLFGQNEREYSSFALAQFSLFKLLLASANFDFDSMSNKRAHQLIFYSFYVLVYIVFSGVFLAIISDAYSYVMVTYEKRPELDYFEVFWSDRKSNTDDNNNALKNHNIIIIEPENDEEIIKIGNFRSKLIDDGFKREFISQIFHKLVDFYTI